MSDNNLKKKTRFTTPVFRFLAAVLLVSAIFGISFISLKIYLSTPQAAFRVSRLLSSSLHQPVRVGQLQLDGGTLRLGEISIANPHGFSGNLATAGALAIQPQWSDILRGRRSFRLIALEGLKLHLSRNSAGVWNFSELQRSLTSKEPSDTELFMRHLAVSNGTVQINDQVVRNINLQLYNVSSKGRGDSDLELVFEDAAHHRYTIAGRVRGGSEPTLHLTLTASAFTVNGVAGMLAMKQRPLYEEEPGTLKVVAVMQGKQTRVSLDHQFRGVRVTAGSPAVKGTVSTSAVYDAARDEARLETFTVTVADLVKLHASGTASELGTERKFTARLTADEIDLARVALLLPEAERRGTMLGGKLDSTMVNVAGNAARGITSASGAVTLHDGAVVRSGRSFIKGLNGTLRLAAAGKDVRLSGRLFSGGGDEEPLLQNLDAAFNMALSSKLIPLSAKISPFSVRAMGIHLKGSLAFNRGVREPFQVALQVPSSSLQSLGPILKRYSLQSTTGNASLVLQAAGQGLRDLNATGRIELRALQGQRGGKPFSLKRGNTDFSLVLGQGRLELTGDAQVKGAAFAGRGGEGALSYRLADNVLTLSKSTFQAEDVSGSIERVTATVPRLKAGPATRYPLLLELAGGRIRRGPLTLNGVSGGVDGAFVANAPDKWLEGKAHLKVAEVARHGSSLGAPAVQLTFARTGARGEISGSVLGGQLAGTVAFNPFAMDAGATFQVGIAQAQLAKASLLGPEGWGARAGGLVDITSTGSYSSKPGLDARLTVKAQKISVSNTTGKTLLSDGGIVVRGDIAGQKIRVDTAVVSAGEAAFTVNGAMEDAFSARRKGHFTVALPVTPVNGMVDPVVNILPRMVQEATLGGTVAGEGALELQDSRMLLQGTVRLKDVDVELDAQRLQVADVTGSIPFSLDLSGNNIGRTFDTLSFTRENYPRLLGQFRRQSGEASSITLSRLMVGPLDLGRVGLQMSAGNGVTRIDGLKASLYGGNVFGKAAFSVERGLYSRADLLLEGLSLKQLCLEFPEIKGYISGLLDGVISIDAVGTKLAGLSGFTELWAREDKREKRLISKEFLQKLSGKKLSGFFFRNDRPYDKAEINAILEYGYLTFELLDIVNTNFFGVTDLSVSIAPTQNRIALAHLFDTIQQAAARGIPSAGGQTPPGEQPKDETPVAPGFQWQD